jgi:gliding motility-associated-like protein
MRKSYLLLLLFLLWASLTSLAQYRANGDAVATSQGCYRLTQAQTFQGGSVWNLNRVNINQDFELYFTVNLGCLDANGADGIAFVLQPISSSIGSAGGGIGYAGISPSFALEIDTWQNPSDPVWDHVAIVANGDVNHSTANTLAGPLPALPGAANIEDCMDHILKVTWSADSMIFRAFIDCELRISYQGNIVQNIFNNNPRVFFGITAATGGSINEHRFCLEYISFTEALQDTPICENTSIRLFAGTGSSYTWRPGAGLDDSTIARPLASPDTTTTYTVEITDLCNQPRYDTVTVRVDTPITVDLGPDQLFCRGDSVRLSAGGLPGRYFWTGGSQDSFLWVSQPGRYELDIINGCGTFDDAVNLNQPAFPTQSILNVACHGNNSGQITVSSASTAPFTFNWFDENGNNLQSVTNNSGNDQLAGLSAGRYRVAVTEGNGCTDTLDFVVTEPPPLLASILRQTNLLCHGDSNGLVIAGAVGGTPPYRYGINGLFQNSGSFNNLKAGSYTMVVQDANGCDTTLSFTITQPPPLDLQVVEQKNVDCFGNSNGRIRLQASNGVPPYQFSLNGGPFGSDSVFAGLSAGSYLLTLQDGNGCEQEVQVQISEPPQLTGGLDSLGHVFCHGDSSGWIRLGAMGGTLPYVYSLDGINYLGTDSFPNLPAGMYTGYVQDDSGCVVSEVISLLEPPPLQAVAAGILDVDCRGNATGAISVAAQGGTPPYRYQTAGRAFSRRDTLDSLLAGAYLVRVQDSNGCETDFSVIVNEPAADLTGNIASQQDVDCFGNANGSVTVTANGGTSPYQYSIDGRTFGGSPTFPMLSARPYTVTIRDTNGCTFPIPVQVTSPTGLSSQLLNFSDVACHGDSSGSVTILGSGGSMPYQYSYDSLTFFPTASLTGIPAGSYQAYLRDANNCLVSVAFDIYEPPPLVGGIVWQKDVDCFGADNGAVRLFVNGGRPPYRFSADSLNFQPSTYLSGLPAGPYNLTVVDDSGCVFQQPTRIVEPPDLITGIGVQANVSCFGDSNAYVSVTASGGVPAYQYQLLPDTLGPDSIFTALKAGAYTLVIQDDSLCSDTLAVDITEPPLLVSSLSGSRSIACFGDSTGYGVVATSGGTPAYQYALNGGAFAADSIFRNLAAGSYQVVVRDDSLCTDTVDFSLTESPLLVANVIDTTDILCHGEETGGFVLSVQGGIPPYLFDRDGLGFGSDSSFQMLPAGVYEVTVRDDSLCTRTFDIPVREPDTLLVIARSTDVLCFGDATGTAQAEATGGVPPYQFLWNSRPPQDQAFAGGLPKGTYLVTLTDDNGCVDQDTVEINEPPLLQIALESWVDAYCDWPNGSATVSATGGINDNYTFLWNSDPPQNMAMAVNIPGGLYQATVIDENGCRDSIEVPIANTPPADPGFFTEPTSPILLSEADVQFVNTSEGAVAYQWRFGDGLGNDAANPLHTYQEPGEYVVTLTAFNEYFECPTDTQLVLTILPDGQLYLANAFTPNGDGYNDIFYVVGEGVVAMEMQIFDRWGRVVAVLNSLEEGWDGFLPRGGSATEGVYTYRIEALFNSGARIERAGTITLIR